MKQLRETMDRFSLLPFSIGCVSHSSVDVIETQPRKSSHGESYPSPPGREEIELKLNQRPNIGEKLHRLVRGFKGLPQMFQGYREEEEEVEMEIGLPTEVHHVGHIGWDGVNNTVSGIMPFPSSLSLRQFELAVAAETNTAST